MGDGLFDIFQYAFMQRALLAAVMVAGICGALGVFVVLRRTALMGDALAHTSFGGIAIGLVAGLLPIEASLIAAIAGGFALHEMRRRKIYGDLSVAVMYSAGLAGGVVLLSATGGLNVSVLAFLFGSILTVTWDDVLMIGLLCAVCAAALLALFREFFLMTFDDDDARTSGVPTRWLDLGLTMLLAVTVVLSMRAVGVLLVASLLSIPAASSLQLRLGLGRTIAASMGLATLAAVAGIILSYYARTATGGTIVLLSLTIFVTLVGLSAAGGKKKSVAKSGAGA
jgi:zinc transport system permease protein